MDFEFSQKQSSRRKMLRDSASLGAGALLAQLFPGSLLRAVRAQGQQAAAPAADSLAAVRAQIGTVPIQTQKLADNLTLLSGPGGNVVVLNGADGKFVVDTFLAPAWPRLKESLSSLGDAPLKLVIDTHWHFDRPTARCRCTQTRIFTFASRRPTSFTWETLFSTASIPSSIPEPAARSLA
jgi:hypothetical protein